MTLPLPAASAARRKMRALTVIAIKSCAALMLLDILFAGPRDAAEFFGGSGDVPENSTEAFAALLHSGVKHDGDSKPKQHMPAGDASADGPSTRMSAPKVVALMEEDGDITVELHEPLDGEMIEAGGDKAAAQPDVEDQPLPDTALDARDQDDIRPDSLLDAPAQPAQPSSDSIPASDEAPVPPPVSGTSSGIIDEDGNEIRLAAFARREAAPDRSVRPTPQIDAGRSEGATRTPSQSSTPPQLPSANAPSVPPVPPQVVAHNPAQFAQSGLAALLSGQGAPQPQPMEPLTLTGSSETGEIRLETGKQTLARAETPHALAARAGTPTQFRLAAGQIPAIAQMMVKRFADGGRSFDIRLDPPELGRVNVRLEIGADRTVQAMLTAEKPEALNELQRHQRELEKALAEAGLDLGESGIGFALFEQNEGQTSDGDGTGVGDRQQDENALALDLELADQPAPLQRFGFTLAQRGGVDVRI